MTLAVTTGLDSFSNPQEIGPLFPFDGLVVVFFVIGLLLWLGWHAIQITGETHENREAEGMYREMGIERAMFHGGSALIATDEEWEEAQRRKGAPPPGQPPGGEQAPGSGSPPTG
jgi:hypothetical protein